MASLFNNLDALGSIDPLLAQAVGIGGAVAETIAGTSGALVAPLTAPVLGAVAPIANIPLDASGPVVEPAVTSAGNILQGVLPLTGDVLHEYLEPSTSAIHLPATGDLLTALLGGGVSGEPSLLGSVLGNVDLFDANAAVLGISDIPLAALDHLHL